MCLSVLCLAGQRSRKTGKGGKIRKSLLYIGHNYHDKTGSTAFLQELLAERYAVEYVSCEPGAGKMEEALLRYKGRSFDVLVVFQLMPEVEALKKLLEFKHAVFFPMYDGSHSMSPYQWSLLRDFTIINFSLTLHLKLEEMGLSSRYIQYFPKPTEVDEYGDDKSVFFWQRITHLNAATVERLFANMDIRRFHIHKSIDPLHHFMDPSPGMMEKSTFSTWFETRKEMLDVMAKCSFYVSPREYEGIGMSFLEAMAMGRCVVAIDNPTMNEYISDGETGLLFKLQDVHPLAADLDVRKIQENARAFIAEGFKRFEGEKRQILDWVEADVRVDESRLASAVARSDAAVERRYPFAHVPIITIRKNSRRSDYALFGVIPLLRRIKSEAKTRTYLFGLFRIWPIPRMRTRHDGFSKR